MQVAAAQLAGQLQRATQLNLGRRIGIVSGVGRGIGRVQRL
mgnify:CR=1 FL=1